MTTVINDAIRISLEEELAETKPEKGYASRTDILQRVVTIMKGTHLNSEYPASEYKSQNGAEILEGIRKRLPSGYESSTIAAIEAAVENTFASHKRVKGESDATSVSTGDPIEDTLNSLRDMLKGSTAKASIDEEQVKQIVEAIVKEHFDAMDTKTIARTRIAHSAASGDETPVMAELLKYYKAGELNRDRVLVCAPPSFGKSFDIKRLGKTYDAFFEHNCSSDPDELSTLKGSVLPDGKGAFINVDGVLTQAMRVASEGKNVLFFFDEILRWGQKAESFLSFLQPFEGHYEWRTSKPDSSGSLELLRVPCERIHFVAAANLNGGRPVEALWSRFEEFRIEFSEEIAVKIGKAVCTYEGLPSADIDHVATKFAKAMRQTRHLLGEMQASYGLDFRRLATAIRMSENPLEHLATKLEHYCANWDSILGDMAPDSKTALEAIGKELAS